MMGHFDDLPGRGPNHVIDEKAEAAFQALIARSEDLILQRTDRKDYGTDCQIEVLDGGRPTNVRLHVQLKGTERALNSDGSVSVSIARTNLNYLVAQPYSLFACFHVPTASLRVTPVEDVLRRYEHGGKNWTAQQTLTVLFVEELTVDRLRALAGLSRSQSRLSRDRRIEQIGANLEDIPRVLRETPPSLHVPDDPATAAQIAAALYDSDQDATLSGAFGQFEAVLGADSDAMGFCYMAEINLGMAGRNWAPDRINYAIMYFQEKLDIGRYQRGSLLYTIGNAHSALGDEAAAKTAYEAASGDQAFMAVPAMAAQLLKNLGSSIERLGNADRAADFYRSALQLSPDLPEAHFALANYHHVAGRFEDALEHYDRVVFTERQLGHASAVAGWRLNVLFNLGDARGAFREINALLNDVAREPAIWSWCARQVSAFGRTSISNARSALIFWRRYIAVHPDVAAARREILLCELYLRAEGGDIGKMYSVFRAEFDAHIVHVSGDEAAFLWDRLGHWAQDEGDWIEAERCFRKAYDLAGGHFGYCLGTALNFLDRHEESLPILREQAESIQPDAMSWFQVGVASEKLGHVTEAVDAYRKALALDPDYALAIFNLGGVLWNSGDIGEATIIWHDAVERFPDHELTARLRDEFTFLF